jgi:NhaP-type Na+/H+ or K+/H+ antiporter
MTYEAILVVSCLLLIAFGVDRLSKHTGVPSVVVMIAIGMIGKPLMTSAGVELTGVDASVPLLGALGLVLIVLEGAFDLRLSREDWRANVQALLSASVGVLVCAAFFSVLGMWLLNLTAYDAMLLALPVSVISSAVAIPASAFMAKVDREFVVYESSTSDILGILLFFAVLNSDRTVTGILYSLAINGSISIFLGIFCALGLLYALFKLSGHIRFIPLLSGLFALYALGKLWHLSPLIMVLMFGLILNNPALLTGLRWFRNMVSTDAYADTVREFKSLTAELTFAVRGLFFVLLGYWTDLGSVGHWGAWLTAGFLLLGIYLPRYWMLTALSVRSRQTLTWLAPRGLISVLLYFSAKEIVHPPAFLDGALMLVVMLSAIAMGGARWRQHN